MPDSTALPQKLRDFVHDAQWTFAKTYAATWPHEYIVRERVDEQLFVLLVRHIREHGYQGAFYRKVMTYFEEDGLVYWTMGEPIEVTTIINRCRKDETYENRLKCGTLPEQIKKSQVGAGQPPTHPDVK
jgi:hypothetical protein